MEPSWMEFIRKDRETVCHPCKMQQQGCNPGKDPQQTWSLMAPLLCLPASRTMGNKLFKLPSLWHLF